MLLSYKTIDATSRQVSTIEYKRDRFKQYKGETRQVSTIEYKRIGLNNTRARDKTSFNNRIQKDRFKQYKGETRQVSTIEYKREKFKQYKGETSFMMFTWYTFSTGPWLG